MPPLPGSFNRTTIEKTGQQLNKWHWLMIEMRYAEATYEEIANAIREKGQTNKYTMYTIQRYFSINGLLYDVYNQYVQDQNALRLEKARSILEREVETAAGYVIKRLNKAIQNGEEKVALDLSFQILDRVKVFDPKKATEKETEAQKEKEIEKMSAEEITKELEKHGYNITRTPTKAVGEVVEDREVQD